MIHYALRCGSGHEFDGWFNNSASFDAQSAGGLLDCPICADTHVERALMAPRLRTGQRAAEPALPKPEAASTAIAIPPPPTPPAVPDQVRAMLQRIRAEVETRCDYVGPRFAAEARRIHEGGEAPRPIYGEATPDEAAALADDGIDIAHIPWVPRADS